jgi:hypothetical protein
MNDEFVKLHPTSYRKYVIQQQRYERKNRVFLLCRTFLQGVISQNKKALANELFTRTFILFRTPGGTRTRTSVSSQDFKSCVSTIPPPGRYELQI